MKKLTTIFLLFCCYTSLIANGHSVSYKDINDGIHQLSFSIDDWKIVETTIDGVTYNVINFNSSTVTTKKGWAELPFISSAIQLPAQKDVDLSIVKNEYKDYQLSYPLLPSRGIIYRNQDPDAIPYIIDPASIVDEFYPVEIATADNPFIVRDVRGTAVRLYPFQYNSATNTLRVYTKVDVQLSENEKSPTNPLLKENLKPVKEMIGIYESMFINFDKSRYDLTMADFGEILIITTSRDQAAIQPYIQWKREKGFIVHEEVVATGTNVKTLIQESYNNNNNILYVQIVGDWADIKVENSIDNAPCDPKMGCVVGTDNFPEIAIGRFSCSNASQLTTQVNKTINYEKSPNMDAAWRSTFTGIASDEGPGDDAEYDYTHVQRIYTERLQPNLNYTTHNENYGSGVSANQILQNINLGTSTIAYCGHGSETSWVTSGFNNSNVNQLTNGEKLPFIVSVACNNGSYQESGDCFAEAWLKKENGGAVVTWMSSISQPWQPPMRGEDYFYDILGGGFDYSEYSGQNGISTSEQRTTWGAITVNSLNLMLTESQGSSDIETAHTWCTFGDASLQLRTSQPYAINSSSEVMLVGLPYTTTITSAQGPVANALVCLSKDGEYYSGITDENGSVSIETNLLPGEILLVVTAFNAQTLYETINCISPDGPFIIYDSFQLENDGILSYGETTGLSLTLKNVGTQQSESGLTVTLSSEDENLTINNSTVIFESMEANSTQTQSGFVITASPEIEDGESFTINVTVSDNDTSWTSRFTVTAYKPILSFGSMFWNGSYVPGETLDMTLTAMNNGGYPVFDVSGIISTDNEYVTINSATQNFGDIANGENANATYSITISEDCPDNEVIDFELLLTGDEGSIIGNGNFTISNKCNLQFDLVDTYGDGWNGASIIVSFDDGSSDINIAMTGGGSEQHILEVNSGVVISLSWQSGSYDGECQFTVSYQESGVTIYEVSDPDPGFLTSFEMNCGVTCDGVFNLAVVTGGSGIMNLSWTAPEAEVTSYNIYREDVLISSVTETSYQDTGIEDGYYTYCVEPVFADGCIGLLRCVTGFCGNIFEVPTTGTNEITICEGMIYDNGGENGNYSSNSNGILVIFPMTDGAMIHLTGTYDIEKNYDFLYVYDGAGTSGSLLGTFSDSGPKNIDLISTVGALTLKFTSDGSVERSGFALNSTCEGGIISTLKGDVNNDNIVNVLDVVSVVAYTIEQSPTPFIIENADVNEDGFINVLDIVGIVNIIYEIE